MRLPLILFATRVAYASRHPHLSVVQLVKDQFRCAVVSFRRHQQRSEIMKRFLHLVNTSLKLFSCFLFFRAALLLRRVEEVRILQTYYTPSTPFSKNLELTVAGSLPLYLMQTRANFRLPACSK